jgi:predicted RNase H-like nuclease (RuvC/YqgF family)
LEPAGPVMREPAAGTESPQDLKLQIRELTQSNLDLRDRLNEQTRQLHELKDELARLRRELDRAKPKSPAPKKSAP